MSWKEGERSPQGSPDFRGATENSTKPQQQQPKGAWRQGRAAGCGAGFRTGSGEKASSRLVRAQQSDHKVHHSCSFSSPGTVTKSNPQSLGFTRGQQVHALLQDGQNWLFHRVRGYGEQTAPIPTPRATFLAVPTFLLPVPPFPGLLARVTSGGSRLLPHFPAKLTSLLKGTAREHNCHSQKYFRRWF